MPSHASHYNFVRRTVGIACVQLRYAQGPHVRSDRRRQDRDATQAALNQAPQRIRELEAPSAAMAERMSAATERADLLEMQFAGLAEPIPICRSNG